MVTLVRLAGSPPTEHNWVEPGTWWEVDAPIASNQGFYIPYAKSSALHPIDHQPADEDWTADFNRMINKREAKA